MKRIEAVTIIALAVAAAAVVFFNLPADIASAQSAADWSKDPRLIKQWFYKDQGNVDVFLDWGRANLSQDQIDSCERVMFPDLPQEQQKTALELLKMQAEGYSLERIDDADVKAALVSLDKAIASAKAKEQQAQPEPVEVPAPTKE